MVEMTIDSIRVSLMNYQRVVILKEKAADRYLPIWIGPAEADAIAVKLQGVNVPRPLTHDLLRSIIDALGASVSSIVVSDLKNDTFYARVTLDVDGGQMEIDSRPSDALALAVRVEAPIYVEEAVLDKAGILLDKETGKPLAEDLEKEGTDSKKVSDEEIKKMSAFRDFLNTLDLGDFDKHKS
ncbi:MAG: bifunctional nuclease family protein [Dehalococcoidales bacterium]|nr:bifunctional nuclease family protein [Dehalococcoidales bacterium]